MSSINYHLARDKMVQQQLRTWDVFDPLVLDLFATLPREDFLPDRFKHLAYSDTPLPLGNGHFIAPPREQARMLQALALKPSDRVLEVGTGSGYITLCLAWLSNHLVTVDIDPAMTQAAQKRLHTSKIDRVHFHTGDASAGWNEEAPYDAICIQGSFQQLPDQFKQQLRVGGRLYAVLGNEPAMSATLITRLSETQWKTKVLFETVVPRLMHGEPKPEFEF
jgi:protein-L-isoaspartate(D-aspartate) O-methyltransferase